VIKNKIKLLPWWGLIFLIMPLAVDGTIHLISDLTVFGARIPRYKQLVGCPAPSQFYGDGAWGSFNAWMRLVTGVVFGWGTSWFLFPLLNDAFKNFMFGSGFRGGT